MTRIERYISSEGSRKRREEGKDRHETKIRRQDGHPANSQMPSFLDIAIAMYLLK